MVTILQHDVAVNFIYPFLLMFFLVFAILEKTKILGEEKKQINALVAFVIGLIFVSVLSPKEVVNNLILFLTIAIVIVFIVLLLWGFIAGEEGLKWGNAPKALKWIIGIAIIIAVVIAVLWAAGVTGIIDSLFNQSWSNDVWTNIIFVVIVAIALAIILGSKK